MVESSIRDKLDAYRRQKRKEEMTEFIKNAIQTAVPWNRNKSVEDTSEEEPLKLREEPEEDGQDMESTCSDDSVDELRYSKIKIVKYFLYFLLWSVLYVIAIEYEFGAIYFILSMLVFIGLNTRSRPKKPGELSAYSVFNPDCKPIEGTIDAAQFEREIRYGLGSVQYT